MLVSLAVVLALCDGLEVGSLDREYGLAMQQLQSLARACAEQKGTTIAMCRRLIPFLASEWGWWVHERPTLLQTVAGKLLDCSLSELVQRIAPHSLPHIVIFGGLALQNSDGVAVISNVELNRGLIATEVLQTLATWLGSSAKQLLVENMHMILAEVFSRQAADDSLDDNDINLINASLEFMYTNGACCRHTFFDVDLISSIRPLRFPRSSKERALNSNDTNELSRTDATNGSPAWTGA